jgi:hypothetical protein
MILAKMDPKAVGAFTAACLVLMLSGARSVFGSSGTEAASFLDIPVGAGPAAMGSAYSALAVDAYAPTWNPAGLAFMDSLQVAAQHLAYVQSTDYEYASFGLPFDKPRECAGGVWCGTSGVGGSIQYFGSGDISGLDAYGNPTGSYSSHFAAYNLSYGRAFGDQLSLGATGKLVNAGLAGVSANAFGMDLGSYYKLRNNIQLAATLMNVGRQLTFLNEGDPLPLTFHLGGAYQPVSALNLGSELLFPRNGLVSFRLGAEWMPNSLITLRTGYRTDTLSGLSPLAGFSTGIGINVWGAELAYAWVPYGELGDSNYISLVVKFGETRVARSRNLIQVTHQEQPPARQPETAPELEYQQLMNLLSDEPAPGEKSGDANTNR